MILKDVYLNNSDRIVNVNVKVLNDINNEITLKDGNIYQLNPNEYLSLDVTFNPANNSEKNINLEFSTENGCSKPIAKFNATIGSVNILANSYDFGKVRVKTPKDGFIKVENNSTFNITLNDIEINTNNYFIFDDIKTTPLTLAPNSSKNINIKYVSNVEKDIVEIVKLKGLIVEQSNEPITIETQIKVISYLPNLNTVNKITFPKTDLGVATNSIGLKIKNNSLFGDLKIQEIRFKNNKSNSDFSFVANPNLKNIDVLSNGELNLNLIFKPTKNGFQSDTLEIIADNVEGPDPVNFIKTEVILEGNTNTIDNLVFEDISFGNTFLCANPQKSVTIDNQSGSGKITFTVAKINNSSDFEIVLPNSLEVLNGQTSSFDIIYTPQNSGTHNETIEVSFSDGRKGTFGISGESTTIPFKSTFKNKNELLTPGNLANIGFVSNFDSENYGEISTIIYTLKFDPTFFRADKNPFTTDLGDTKWSWTVDISNQSEGVLIITGKSNDKSLEKPKKINNSLNLQTYLADKTETFITVDTKIDNNCVIAETDTTTIKYQGCLIDNRIITISDNTFYVKELTPNVMSTSQELNYGLGFDCEVDIKLYDIMGNLINDLGKETQKQGEHKVLLPIEQIPNGMYYIQLYAGPFVKNIKFIINK